MKDSEKKLFQYQKPEVIPFRDWKIVAFGESAPCFGNDDNGQPGCSVEDGEQPCAPGLNF